MTKETMPAEPAPWWRYGHVWLVIAGPAAVAVRSPDPVVAADYYRQGIEINRTLERQKALMPAMQGRNHAATPAAPPPARRE
jgi:uncharacterized protein